MSGQGAQDQDRPTACPACGAALNGRYCHVCGQDTDVGPHPLREVLSEAFSEVTDLDGKTFRTLNALLLHPGRLLNAYRAGASNRFITPLKLFVFTTALFLIVLNLTDVSIYQAVRQVADPSQPVRVSVEGAEGVIQVSNSVDRTLWMQQRVDPPVDPAIETALDAAAQAAAGTKDSAILDFEAMMARQEPVIGQRLADWLPNLIWLLAPIHALLLAPFFGIRRLFTEHLAFSFWAHATLFMLLMALAAINALGAQQSVFLILPVYLAYLTVAARSYYAQSWLTAGIKSLVHCVIYVGLVLLPCSFLVALSAIDRATWLALVAS